MPRAKKEQTTQEAEQEQEVRMPVKKDFISGTGRRKTAVARVFLYKTAGEILINGKPMDEHFSSEKEQTEWKRPFHLVGVSHPEAQYSATIKVAGSGTSAQLGAVVHGISRALAKTDESFAKILRRAGLMTRDSRMVERKKYWLRKARKAPQYSKR